MFLMLNPGAVDTSCDDRSSGAAACEPGKEASGCMQPESLPHPGSLTNSGKIRRFSRSQSCLRRPVSSIGGYVFDFIGKRSLTNSASLQQRPKHTNGKARITLTKRGC